jgi:hypothetical protein
MSDDERERFFTDFSRLQTLILDAIERLAVLETSGQYADMQRQSLLDSIARLGDRLDHFAKSAGALEVLSTRVDSLTRRIEKLDALVSEIRGGVKVTKVLWSAIWAIVGAAIAVVAAWAKLRS